jgi:hypothetical protein
MREPSHDSPVSDQAPETDIFAGYDHCPCNQYDSCVGGRAQRVDWIHLLTNRGNETSSDLLRSREAAVLTTGVIFPTTRFEC